MRALGGASLLQYVGVSRETPDLPGSRWPAVVLVRVGGQRSKREVKERISG